MALFLKASEAAQLLGVSDQTVVAMCKRGEIKHIKVGKLYLVNKAAFEQLIGRQVNGGEEHTTE